MQRTVSIIGSTGSIGTQALDVVRVQGFRVAALAAGSDYRALEAQIRTFSPRVAALADPAAAKELKSRVRDLPVRVLAGKEGVCEAAACGEADIVLNAVVGIAGLAPTLAVIDAKKTLALANKESLVAAGEIVMKRAGKAGVRVLPVDSEHSAIFQCLQGSQNPAREIKRLVLTASGGPFFGWSHDRLRDVTPEMALRHPNWSMGAKITIDSATLMNKGLELIEASRLFGVEPDRIEIVVQPQSVIHSAVEFADGAVIAQLGVPDMRIPIQYALTYPERVASPAAPLDLFATGKLTFARPDTAAFKCLDVLLRAAKLGGLCTAAASGAGEAAVALFLKRRIGFNDIGDLVEAAAFMPLEGPMSVDAVYAADAAARRLVAELAGKQGDLVET